MTDQTTGQAAAAPPADDRDDLENALTKIKGVATVLLDLSDSKDDDAAGYLGGQLFRHYRDAHAAFAASSSSMVPHDHPQSRAARTGRRSARGALCRVSQQAKRRDRRANERQDLAHVAARKAAA